MVKKTIWFIRHGESEANAGLATTDGASIKLTQKGYEQSQALVDQIQNAPGAIVMSKFIRTQQTAEAIINTYPLVKTHILNLHEFDFLSPKLCVNTTVEDRKPMVYNYWLSCTANVAHGDDSESFEEFYNRVITSLKEIEKIDANFIVVFSHGHVMRAMWQYMITKDNMVTNSTMKYFRDKMTFLKVPNCDVFKAEFSTDGWSIESPDFNPDDYSFRD